MEAATLWSSFFKSFTMDSSGYRNSCCNTSYKWLLIASKNSMIWLIRIPLKDDMDWTQGWLNLSSFQGQSNEYSNFWGLSGKKWTARVCTYIHLLLLACLDMHTLTCKLIFPLWFFKFLKFLVLIIIHTV